jgi:hypothetical protein
LGESFGQHLGRIAPRDRETVSTVIVRLVRSCALGRTIQYSGDGSDGNDRRGVLDAPPEPVIGLAEGETRWRGMTVLRAATIRIAFGIRGAND